MKKKRGYKSQVKETEIDTTTEKKTQAKHQKQMNNENKSEKRREEKTNKANKGLKQKDEKKWREKTREGKEKQK